MIEDPGPYNLDAPLVLPSQEPDYTDLGKLLFEHTQGLINFADNKAQLILAGDTVLATTMTLLGKDAMITLASPGSPVLITLSSILTLIMFGTLFVSAYFAFISVRPTTRIIPSRNPSLLFFGHIAVQGHDEFIEAFQKQSHEEIMHSLLGQVWAKSRIVSKKFSRMYWSFNFLLITLALWAISQTLAAFAR